MGERRINGRRGLGRRLAAIPNDRLTSPVEFTGSRQDEKLQLARDGVRMMDIEKEQRVDEERNVEPAC